MAVAMATTAVEVKSTRPTTMGMRTRAVRTRFQVMRKKDIRYQ
jgi:hypothetical protein